jgi:hypothetical protein
MIKALCSFEVSDTTQYQKRLETSTKLMGEPQILQVFGLFDEFGVASEHCGSLNIINSLCF